MQWTTIIGKITYQIKNMQELKLKTLWAIDINGIQWTAFKYKAEAKKFATYLQNKGVNGQYVISQKKLITDKY